MRNYINFSFLLVLFSMFFVTNMQAQPPNCENDTTDFIINPWPSEITIQISDSGELSNWDEPHELAGFNTYDPAADTGSVYDEPVLIYDCEVPGINYNDQIFNYPDRIDILRKWSVAEWISGDVFTQDQWIRFEVENTDCQNDIFPPIAVCETGIEVVLGEDFTAEISPEDVDGGSWDNCSFTLSLDRSTFDQDDIGSNTVVLTVTDAAGNTTACFTEVIVKRYPCTEDDTDFIINPWPSDITISATFNSMFDLIKPSSLGQYNTYDENTGIGEVYDGPVLHYDCEVPGVAYEDIFVLVSIDLIKIIREWTVVNWLDINQMYTEEQVITVNLGGDCADDQIAPVAICESGVVLSLSQNGEATLLPEDLDGGSYDNCGSITLSLSQSVFNRSHLGNNTVVLTVTDEAGNANTCWTEVIVENRNTNRLQVCVEDPWGRPVSEVQITNGVFTDDSGCAYINRDDELILEKQDRMNNGVTTLDAALIYEHVLAIRSLDPDVSLAADISEEGIVSTLDYVYVHQIVTNNYNGSCPSWKFYNDEDPRTFGGSTMKILGVKMGDVNGTYNGNRANGNIIKEEYLASVSDEILNAGVEYSIPVEMEVQSRHIAMEYVFRYDPSRIEVLGLNNVMTEEGAILTDNGNGEIQIDILGELKESLAVEEKQIAFELNIRSLTNSTLRNELDMESQSAKTELIWIGESDAPYYIEIDWDGVLSDIADVNVGEQNAKLYPNPVAQTWTVELQEGETAEFVLFDMYGRTIIQDELTTSKQYNRNDLENGVYFYTIKNKEELLKTGRMLIQN